VVSIYKGQACLKMEAVAIICRARLWTMSPIEFVTCVQDVERGKAVERLIELYRV
jgi:hypothetical protein